MTSARGGALPKKREHQTGTVSYEARRQRWIGRVQVGVVDGRRRWREVSAPTRKEAVELLEVLRAQLRVNQAADGRQRVSQYLDWWIAECIEPVRAAGTTRSYRQVVRLYLAPALGHHKLYDLNPQHVQTVINDLAKRVSPRTVQYARAVLRSALSRAIKLGHVTRNAAAYADIPTVRKKEQQPLTVQQAQTLMRSLRGNPREALFATALLMGFRPGETLGLRWSDIDLDAGAVTTRKQLQFEGNTPELVDLKTERAHRAVTMPNVTVEILKAHRRTWVEQRLKAGSSWRGDAWDLAFCTSSGLPLRERNVVREFKRVLTAASLPDIRLYDLRHTTPTLLLALGVDTRIIMAILGHSQISMTTDYTHVLPSVSAEAMGRLNDLMEGRSP